MTGRVNILWYILNKNYQKVKFEVTGTKKHSFWLIYLKLSTNLLFWVEGAVNQYHNSDNKSRGKNTSNWGTSPHSQYFKYERGK